MRVFGKGPKPRRLWLLDTVFLIRLFIFRPLIPHHKFDCAFCGPLVARNIKQTGIIEPLRWIMKHDVCLC